MWSCSSLHAAFLFFFSAVRENYCSTHRGVKGLIHLCGECEVPGVFLRNEIQAFKLVHPVSAFNWDFERWAAQKSFFSGLYYVCPWLIFPSPSRDCHIRSASRRKRVLHLSRHTVCAAARSGDGFEHSQMVPHLSQHVYFQMAVPASWTGTGREPIPPSCWVRSLRAVLQPRQSKPVLGSHACLACRIHCTLRLGSAHLTASSEQVPFKRLFFLCNPSKRHFHSPWKIN